jgi:branched-chain amino acid transport system ATP-binding protein
VSFLGIEGLVAGYGPITVLHGLALAVDEGEVCVILGGNGAGKTTTLRAISGLVRRAGRLRFDGHDLGRLEPEAIARAGIGHVADNLALGGARRRDRAALRRDEDMILDLFPRLHERRRQRAGSLSGGEQQMLAIGRALMAAPRLLLLDEPSLGLSPRLTEEVFGALRRLLDERRLTMLLVEQNAALALALARHAYVLEAGVIVAAGAAADMLADDRIQRAYLGI